MSLLCSVDDKGDILTQKVYGFERGPFILLNAHLDRVYGSEEGRQILKVGSLWTNSNRILGADDRVGVMVLLELAKKIPNSGIKGAVEFLFTVEEEIALVGARRGVEYFFWDVDAAFDVDRRGRRYFQIMRWFSRFLR